VCPVVIVSICANLKEGMKKELKEKIEKLPQSTGVYIFKDQNENILYIGRQKILKRE